MTRGIPLAAICSCRTPIRPTGVAIYHRPFACLRCRRVMRLPDMVTIADLTWLRKNRIGLGPLEADLPVLPPPPEPPGDRRESAR